MSLPNDVTATDATTNTSAFWNALVANYEAIFDGSAFNDEVVKTKYGTVARYLELDSGNTSDPVTLEIGSPYLVIIKDEPGAGLYTELGLFSNGVQTVGITEGDYGASYEKIVAKIIIPTVAGFTASVQNGGPTGDTVTKFLIIKLDNQADSWATSAAIPNPGMSFALNEILTGQKVNRVIANVNTSPVDAESVDSEKVLIANNTKNSMTVLAHEKFDEITAPDANESADVVAILPFTVTENLEGSMLLVTGTAQTIEGIDPDILKPVSVEVYDDSEALVASQLGDQLDWFGIWIPPLDAGDYEVRLSYYLDASNIDPEQVVGAYINMTVLGFGV